MIKHAPIYLLIVMLAGCASTPPVIRYVSAPVPAVVIPLEPLYPIAEVKERTAKQTVLDMAASFELAIGYIDQLRPLIPQPK